RKALQKKLGLAENPNHLVLGFVTRIVKQKGLNILMTKLPDGKTLLESILDIADEKTGGKIQVVILGTPNDARGEEQAAFFRDFLTLHPKYKGQFIFVEKF